MLDYILTLTLPKKVQLNVVINLRHCDLQLLSHVKQPAAAKEKSKYFKEEFMLTFLI